MTVYATAADVRIALRRDLTTAEAKSVGGVIAEAQDLVEAYLNRVVGTTYEYPDTDDVPGAVTRITARMVARVFQQSGQEVGVSQSQLTAGPFSKGTSYASGSTSGNPWLAQSDKVTLKRFRAGGGVSSVQFRSERDYDRFP